MVTTLYSEQSIYYVFIQCEQLISSQSRYDSIAHVICILAVRASPFVNAWNAEPLYITAGLLSPAQQGNGKTVNGSRF